MRKHDGWRTRRRFATRADGRVLCRMCLELEGGNRARRGLRHGPGWTPGS
jgi:hypothetical protein